MSESNINKNFPEESKLKLYILTFYFLRSDIDPEKCDNADQKHGKSFKKAMSEGDMQTPFCKLPGYC